MKQLYDLKRNSKDVIDFVTSQFKERRLEISELIRIWCLNLAWYRGSQNLDFDVNSRTWLRNDPSINKNKVRLVSNLMMPLVRKSVAKMSYIHPVWDVIPATPDEDDIQIANTSTKVLQDLWQQVEMNSKLIRLLFWMLNCGSAFFKVTWDAEAGDEIQVMSNQVEEGLIKAAMEKFGFSEIPQAFNVPQGQLVIDVVTPFNITLDNHTECLDENLWIIESHLRDKDWIVEKFGTKYKNLQEVDETDLLSFPHLYSSKTRRELRKGVLTHELYIKRCGLFKQGLYALVGGGEILIPPRKLPYIHGKLPYTQFTEIITPGNIWGTCVSEQVRANQARYNRISSGVVENINLNSQLQWLNPEQNKRSVFTNEPGAVINYTYPYKPEPNQPRTLPSYVERMLDRTRMDMQDTASSHDVSEAKNEPGIRSGKTVLALQEADDSIYGPVLLMMDEALSATGTLAIQTLAQYVTEERVLYITGEYNAIEAVNFTGAMLKGKNNANYWKVRVKTFGRQAMSRSGREQLARTLIEVGVLNPQTDRDKILHIMGTADLVSMFDQDAATRSYQNDEIQMMLKGQPAKVELAQNHGIHIEVIKKCKNSGKWKNYPPQVKQLIEQHLLEHLKMQAYESVLPQLLVQEIINGTQQPAAGGQPTAAAGGVQAGAQAGA